MISIILMGKELTRSQQMVWLFMANMILDSNTSQRPPWRSHIITFGVWVMGLLLGLNQLDEDLAHDFARRLLHLLETSVVECLDLCFVSDDKLTSFHHRDRHRCIIIVERRVLRATNSLPLSLARIGVI